jgi:DMSO/TMAO reductase YedYZ molybdopterin-dependent catalytic subunit
MRGKHKVLASAFAFSFLAIAFSSFQFIEVCGIETNTLKLSPISLTIVGINGTQVILNEDDVAALPFYRAYGGYRNQLGNVRGLGNYTGVSLNTLCDLVGGLTGTSVVKVIANDEQPYSVNLTFDQVVNGNFTTYSSSGEEVDHSQPLVPMLAYYFNDASINESSGGPLRLAIVGPEGLVTDSKYWVKWVVRVEIIDETVPEFPSPILLSLLLFATSAAAISFKAFKRRRLSAKRFFELAGGFGQ